MKRKIVALAIIVAGYLPTLFAGGVLTNTNQSARFARYMALEASTDVGAAYYNPAGLTHLPKDGFHFSFSNQSAFQKRIIKSTSPLYKKAYLGDGSDFKEFEGKASAPIIPSLQAAYKKGKWVLSGSLAISGGGGKATFGQGLSLFEGAAAGVPVMLGKPDAQYSIDQYMTGKNYIFGGQIGGTYEVNDMFSAYAGFRLNIVSNSYKGHLKDLKVRMDTPTGTSAMVSPSPYLGAALNQLLAIENPTPAQVAQINGLNLLKLAGEDGAYLDSEQSGWGISPIIGFHFNYEKLHIGMKYEFKTRLNVENKTKIDNTGMNNNGMFADGADVKHDIPALFTVGVEYQFIPQLKAALGYHHFFDSKARMDNDKQKHISGTNEYLGSIELQLNKMFAISGGGQITRYGIKDGFQSDLSFFVNSYTLGIGGSARVSENVLLNVGYFYTDYTDYNKKVSDTMHNTYTRENKVFTAGVEFSF